MANTYTLIQAQTVGTAVASIILGSGGTIPQTYTDLKIVTTRRTSDSSAQASYISFNGSTSDFSGGYYVSGEGSGTSSGGLARFVGSILGSGATANTFANSEIYIPNYTSTTFGKSFSVDSVSENNAVAAYCGFYGGLWNPATSVAITSITLTLGAGDFPINSTFYLYGIKNS